MLASPAHAQRIENPVSEFAGLDKITARIIKFEVRINETVQFGALQVTPRVCYNRASSDDPLTTGFVEVDEITLEGKIHRLFSGWMFADSPGLNAVEHPIYDIWLVSCKGGKPPKPSDDEAQEEKPKSKKKKQAQPQPEEGGMMQELPPEQVAPVPQQPKPKPKPKKEPVIPEPYGYQPLQPGVPFDPDQVPRR